MTAVHADREAGKVDGKSAIKPRSLSENGDLLRERGCRPAFGLEFVKYGQYSPHSSPKSGSTPRPLATATILGQAPSDKKVRRDAIATDITPLRARLRDPAWVARFRRGVASAPACEHTPVFQVGFPRSGTTLLDQILDSHPAIQTLEERPAVWALFSRLNELPGGFPDALPELTAGDLDELRALYFKTRNTYQQTRPDALFIDKYPLNLIQVPLIQRVFPDARFLLCLRHPYDVCLSCFTNSFELNPGTVNFLSLEQTAHYYSQVMGLWLETRDQLVPDHHVVHYEQLVADLRGEVGGVLDYLGVDWDEAVTRFDAHARQRAGIATPSYSQVVRPIYSSSVGRWRRYARHLEPVSEILQPFLEAFGYDG